ncbi:unnamed protein product [Angiostrongylus costaricensis]|uniref:Peptidase A2 domain-containing protein n=1 Tax=Angiostrongylus costaricensis TaxID=334426 RepID=A0A0R3PUI2_ANGCS|nr:unnamed protein product [Angiostrongylus costaricensis]
MLKRLNFLLRKYADSEKLIITLMDKLDNSQLRSTTVYDQRKLFEHLHLTLTQLKVKGENVDNQCMFKKVLSKFSNNIQRKVIEKKLDVVTNKDKPFHMDQLLQFIEEVIHKEEKVWQYTSKYQPMSGTINKQEHTSRSWIPDKKYCCMYCRADHKSFNCDMYKTPCDHSQYLRTNKLCAICAFPYSTNCKKLSCFKCQRRHYTSFCFQSTSKETSFQDGSKNEPNRNEVFKDRKYSNKNIETYQPRSKINYVNQQQEHSAPQETIVVEVQYENPHLRSQQTTILPTGEITVVNTTTGTLEKVPVLLDTGAELSFIDASFAAEIGLPIIEQTTLRLRTFGSEEAREKLLNKVSLKAWDPDGHPFSMHLFTHDRFDFSSTATMAYPKEA